MTTFENHINGSKPVLVDFFADWCGPCKTMAPFLSEVKKVLGENATILKLDIDKNPSYAQRYGVQSIPTLILFQHGKIMWKKLGVTPAHEILKQIRSLL